MTHVKKSIKFDIKLYNLLYLILAKYLHIFLVEPEFGPIQPVGNFYVHIFYVMRKLANKQERSCH